MAKASRASAASRPRTTAPDPSSDASLFAHPPDHAEPPDVPIAIATAEYKTLVQLATKHAKQLSRLGVTAEKISALSKLTRRLTVLEKTWQTRRARALSNASKRKQVAEADALKKKLLAAGGFAFRKDEIAITRLATIAEGSGLADTIQDLSDLHEFWTERPHGLAITKATAKDVDRAAELFTTLDELAIEEAADTESAQAHALRNRCFWAASALADDVRAAGRYAFEDEPTLAAKYISRYRTQISRRARRKKPTPKPGPADDKKPS